MIRRCTPPCASGWGRRLDTPWRRRQGEHDAGDGGGDGGDGVDGGDGGDGDSDCDDNEDDNVSYGSHSLDPCLICINTGGVCLMFRL